MPPKRTRRSFRRQPQAKIIKIPSKDDEAVIILDAEDADKALSEKAQENVPSASSSAITEAEVFDDNQPENSRKAEETVEVNDVPAIEKRPSATFVDDSEEENIAPSASPSPEITGVGLAEGGQLKNKRRLFAVEFKLHVVEEAKKTNNRQVAR